MFPLPRSLRAKSVLAGLVPFALVLAVVAVIGLNAYDQVARNVVTQRDAELARVSAARIGERLALQARGLQTIAATDTIRSLGKATINAELQGSHPELASFGFLIDLRTTTTIVPVEYPPGIWVRTLSDSGASLSDTRFAFVGSNATELGSLSLSKPLAAAWLELEVEFFRSVPLALTWLGREGLEEARWPVRPA